MRLISVAEGILARLDLEARERAERGDEMVFINAATRAPLRAALDEARDLERDRALLLGALRAVVGPSGLREAGLPIAQAALADLEGR